MSQALQLIQIQGESRIDSRLVADRLGIGHKAFMETLRTYQAQLERLGSVPFQTEPKKGPNTKRGGDQPKYALLNEDQAIFAATLSRNTSQVVFFKLQLTQAFAEARKWSQVPHVNNLWQQRIEYFHRHTPIPAPYWSVFGMMAGHCWEDEFRGIHLVEDALPDESVGIRWSTYLREHEYDLSLIKKYPHHYPDKRGVKWANIYPAEWLGDFWTWFRGCYLKQHYPVYLKTHMIQPNRHLTEGGK